MLETPTMNSVIFGILLVSTNVYTTEDGDHIRKCSYTIPLLNEQITCYKCQSGQYYIGPCSWDGGNSDCKPCPDGQYNSDCTRATSCAICDTQCRDPDREKVYRNCTSEANLSCICKDGLYRDGSSFCTPHDICPLREGVKRIGNPYNNTECEKCLEGYYSGVESKTEGCKQCSKCSANETVLHECTLENNTVCKAKEKEKSKNDNTCSTITIILYSVLGFVGCFTVMCLIWCYRKRDVLKEKCKCCRRDSGHDDAEQPRENGQEGDTDEIRIEMDDNNTANGISEVQYQKMKKRQSTVKAQGTQTSEEENCRNEIDSGDLGVIMRGSGNADARQPRENDKEGDADKRTHKNDNDKENSDNVVDLKTMRNKLAKSRENATPLVGVKKSDSKTSGNTDIGSGHDDEKEHLAKDKVTEDKEANETNLPLPQTLPSCSRQSRI